jgi:hypothetical protein
MTPLETKELVQKLNQEFEQYNKNYHSVVPFDMIVSILMENGLDVPYFGQNKDKLDDRFHVYIGKNIWLTFSWYFLTSLYEVVIYASSFYDDVKEIKIMDTKETNIAKKKLNAILFEIGCSYQSLGTAIKDVSDALESIGFDATEFIHESMSLNTKEGRIHVAIGNKTFLSFSYYKMDRFGKYEIVAYVS